MELSEKIQKLRKDRGLTQEQLAEQLFVSRTAVSKWETGRGFPSMDSLQMIAKLGGMTLDELLRTEDVIAVARHENQENLHRFASRINALLDTAALLGMFLPLYKVERNDLFYSIPLFQFSGRLTVFYWLLPAAMVLCGLIQLMIITTKRERCKRNAGVIGFLLNVGIVFLLVLSNQPYPAILFFTLLLIKGIVMYLQNETPQLLCETQKCCSRIFPSSPQ